MTDPIDVLSFIARSRRGRLLAQLQPFITGEPTMATINMGAAAVHTIKTTVWLVIQEGGTSTEHYASLYTSQDDANEAARGHRKATYRATEPIAVPCEMRDGQAFVGELDLVRLIEQVHSAAFTGR